MKYQKCDVCGKNEIQVNESIKVDSLTYCVPCFETAFPEEKLLTDKVIVIGSDPTVCFSCGMDNGDASLPKLGTRPVCDNCAANIKKRTFPTWVKAFFIAILGIMIFSIAWNWRFYEGYRNLKVSTLAFQQGELLKAKNTMQTVSEKIPEIEDFKFLYHLYNGIYLLSLDKSTAALAEFNIYKESGFLEPDLSELLFQAEIGASFETKDYDTFLKKTKEKLSLEEDQAISWAYVASAYACKFVETSRDSFRVLTFDYLAKAKQIDSLSAEMKSYYNKIEHRIASKKILNNKEFLNQYPNGWQKN